LTSLLADFRVERFAMPHEALRNPFCTRCIRPGAIPFLFPEGQDAKSLVERLDRNGGRGEIVGAHGTGKSTLLAALIPLIERAGQHVVLIELHDGQRRLPLGIDRDAWLRSPTTVIVDGYEQLSRWRRFLLKRQCCRRGWGLIVTAHASVGLPELYRTTATPELAQKIVDQLMAGQTSPFTGAELAECLARHHGDLRETLFDLYDRYEEGCCPVG
jgi:hypothetical protein